MSTTPDPTPFDETHVEPTPVDPVPPVDPSLTGPEPEPLLGEVPPASEPTAESASEPTAEPRPSLSQSAAALREADLKAFYAFAGFTELALGAVRSTVTDTQRWANARLAELRFRRQELTKQTEHVRKLAEERLPDDVKAVPEVAKGRVTELQEQASSTYNQLADRGQRVLSGVRSDVTGRIDPAFDKIQERIDAARQLIKSRAAAAAAAAPSTTSAPAAAPEATPEAAPLAEEYVPESPVSDGVGVSDVATDEVISPAGHGDEVPPTFDAPADRQA